MDVRKLKASEERNDLMLAIATSLGDKNARKEIARQGKEALKKLNEI